MSEYKQIMKNLFDDKYDSISCYAEALNCFADLDKSDFEDGKKTTFMRKRMLKYFERCTCKDEPTNRIMRQLQFVDEEQKEKYITFLSQFEGSYFEEMVKVINKEKSQLVFNNTLTNSIPFVNRMFDEIESSITKVDGDYLLDVFKNDNVHMLKAYLNENPEILFFTHVNYGSLVHFASYYNSIECLKYITDFIKTFDFFNPRGETPLHLAYSRGSVDVIHYLIEQGANQNELDRQTGLTPRQSAIVVSDLSSFNTLISQNLLKTEDLLNEDCIQIAVQVRQNVIVKEMIEKQYIGFDYTFKSNNIDIFSYAIAMGNVEFVLYAESKGVDVLKNRFDLSNISLAFGSEEPKMIEYFLKLVDLNKLNNDEVRNITDMVHSTKQNLEYFVENYNNYQAFLPKIMQSIMNERINGVSEYLISKLENTNMLLFEDTQTLLSSVSYLQEVDLVDKLLTKEEIDFANNNNVPLLYSLIKNLMFDQVIKALELGARLDVTSYSGQHISLLEQIVFVNAPSKYVEAIIEYGDDIFYENSNGYTPLMIAVMHGNLPTIELFISKGLDPHKKSVRSNKSANDIAKEKKRSNIVTYFKQFK